MHFVEGLRRNTRTIAMPVGMTLGALLCRPITAVDTMAQQMVTPTLIFLMLFFTFCRVKPQQMKFQMLHLWLLLFQVVVSVGVYLLLHPFNEVVAQGALICVLAPVAMAAVVIGGMLGANVTTMATYSLLSNMFIALVAPVILTFAGDGTCTFAQIIGRVAPLLIMPFAAAQMCRLLLPKAVQWIADHSQISFYMWLVALIFAIGRTMTFILDLRNVGLGVELSLAGVALVLCLVQFKVGRMIGRRYGDPTAGGQSLGQKNTVLAIWMAQSFMNPVSSIAPAAYIIYHNSINSYQLWRHNRNVAQ